MRDPRSLYELNPDVQVPPGLPLVAGLTGFADAGSAVAQTTDYLLSTLDTTVIATFDADELLDYRARRPPGVLRAVVRLEACAIHAPSTSAIPTSRCRPDSRSSQG